MKIINRNKSFTRSLADTFIYTAVIPVVLLLLFFCFILTHKVKNENQQNYENTVAIVESSVAAEISGIDEFTSAYENNSKLRSFYFFFYLYPEKGAEDDIAYASTYKDFFVDYASAVNSYLAMSSDYIRGVGFIPTRRVDMAMFYHERGSKYCPIYDYDWTQTYWYKMLNEGGQAYVIGSELSQYLSVQEEVLYFVRPVWNNTRTEIIGYVKIDFSARMISEILDQLQMSRGMAVSIELDNGQYAYRSGDTTASGSTRAEAYNEEYGFSIALNATLGAMYSGLQTDFIILGLLFVALVIFSYTCFRRFSKRVVDSFKPISNTLRLYDGGEKVPKIANIDYGIPEIADVAKLLDTMIDEVDYHIQNEYKSSLEQKKAEFRALQAEINPHFFYNTLNSFLALNRMGEKKELEESIVALSRMFRYTCEKDSGGIRTVGDEFGFLECYLKLQKLRYDERLIYSIEMDPRTADYKIPKLILQPIVENAIVHGLEPSDDPVTIQITSMLFTTRGIGDVLLMSVVNDGAPMELSEVRTEKRVGINNIEERLKTFWPESALVVKGGKGKLTEFHIIVKADHFTEDVTDENTDSR